MNQTYMQRRRRDHKRQSIGVASDCSQTMLAPPPPPPNALYFLDGSTPLHTCSAHTNTFTWWEVGYSVNSLVCLTFSSEESGSMIKLRCIDSDTQPFSLLKIRPEYTCAGVCGKYDSGGQLYSTLTGGHQLFDIVDCSIMDPKQVTLMTVEVSINSQEDKSEIRCCFPHPKQDIYDWCIIIQCAFSWWVQYLTLHAYGNVQSLGFSLLHDYRKIYTSIRALWSIAISNFPFLSRTVVGNYWTLLLDVGQQHRSPWIIIRPFIHVNLNFHGVFSVMAEVPKTGACPPEIWFKINCIQHWHWHQLFDIVDAQ